MPPPLPILHLITPALAADNNGNWQTARRWQQFVRQDATVRMAKTWSPTAHGSGQPGQSGLLRTTPEVMIALHARRSAGALQAFTESGRRAALVLTGTDLYRDIHSDTTARRSLELANLLVVLNEKGVEALPAGVQHKARVIFQSATALTAMALRRPRRFFDLTMVGHLRGEKDPMTALRAMARLEAGHRGHMPRIRLLQIGGNRDEQLGRNFSEGAAALSSIVMTGALPHSRTRQLIRRSQALVLPSLMEGGANVLIEAVCAGVPVLASHISGSVGMLGPQYPGYFEVGDDAGLAALILRCREDADFHEQLKQQCLARSALFTPERERSAVRRLLQDLVAGGTS